MIKLLLTTDEYEGLKDVLRTVLEMDQYFVVDQQLAEKILKYLEEVDY